MSWPPFHNRQMYSWCWNCTPVPCLMGDLSYSRVLFLFSVCSYNTHINMSVVHIIHRIRAPLTHHICDIHMCFVLSFGVYNTHNDMPTNIHLIKYMCHQHIICVIYMYIFLLIIWEISQFKDKSFL